MTTRRTIDNLGVETSVRWAKDQELAEIIKGPVNLPYATELDVTSPSFVSEFSTLFGDLEQGITWASFFSPHLYNEQKKGFLFTHYIAPLLGSEERLEAQVERIKAFAHKVEGQNAEQLPWEEELQKQEEEKEKNIILKLFESLQDLNRFLIDINARRKQYQKG